MTAPQEAEDNPSLQPGHRNMSHAKSILVITDPTADLQPALQRSIRLARSLGASLEILACNYDQHLAGGRSLAVEAVDSARDELLKIHRRRLEALAAPLRGDGLDVRVDVRWEHPLDRGVLRKVAELKPLLVAKDTP
ncbi:MAG TPA: universal stress protein, partial [Gammaproteobacteria bacterium]|nr:universal stress protein [Gammaproteobacteria bacterium]